MDAATADTTTAQDATTAGDENCDYHNHCTDDIWELICVSEYVVLRYHLPS